MAEIDISIVCITYNHEKYIREAIDSFLSQTYRQSKIEIIIADDASTDGTGRIIREYATKYPNIVPVIRKENVGIQNNLLDAMTRAKGKYIALCEGDDYWTDDSKLSRQYKSMEAQPNAALCFHRVKGIVEDSGDEYVFPDPSIKASFSTEGLLYRNYIQTNSVMYRNLGGYRDIVKGEVLPLDWLLHLYHAREGKIVFIDRIMSVYRRHEGGVWWKDEHTQIDFWRRNAIRHIRLFENIERLFAENEKHKEIVYKSLGELIDRICFEVGAQDDYEIATNIARTFPRYAGITITQDVSRGTLPYKRIQDLDDQLKKLQQEYGARTSELEAEKQELLGRIHRLNEQLHDMTNSKSWRITKPLRLLARALGRE